MKRRYSFHPKYFALGETEKYYTDMAANGWELVKRGVYLSRFQKTDPKKMRYRVEVADLKELEERKLPEAQIAVYEDCGWEYVSGHGYIHVFRAPEGSDAPEFYLEPEQQAATLKGLRRYYINSLLPFPVYLAFYSFLGWLLFGPSDSKIWAARWVAQIHRAWVEETVVVIGLVAFLVWGMFDSIWGTWHLSRLCYRMKRGISLDHAPKSKRSLRKVLKAVKWLLIVGVVACFGWNLLQSETYPMPSVSDGPYILLSDIGIVGERTQSWVDGAESEVKYESSLLAEHWDCFEVVDVDINENGSDPWLYQDVYRLKDASMRDRLVKTLMACSVFAESEVDYTEVEVAGLDQAWITERLECIAVKGDLVCIFTHSFDTQDEMLAALQVVAERWSK